MRAIATSGLSQPFQCPAQPLGTFAGTAAPPMTWPSQSKKVTSASLAVVFTAKYAPKRRTGWWKVSSRAPSTEARKFAPSWAVTVQFSTWLVVTVVPLVPGVQAVARPPRSGAGAHPA